MEQNNLEDVKEIIGSAVFDYLNVYEEEDSEETKESLELVNKFIILAEDSYVLVQWPESQEYMEEEWFDEEAILDVECKFGNSAYFIPLKRLL